MRRRPTSAKKASSSKARRAGLPEEIRSSLVHATESSVGTRWAHLGIRIVVRFRGRHAFVGYVDPRAKAKSGKARPEDVLPLFRLEYTGDPRRWRFALFTYSNMRYSPAVNDSGGFTETPERALDRAVKFYLG